LRLGVSVPLNKEQILKAVDGVDEVLVVEELEPIVETQLKNILFDEDVRLKVHGKDYVPRGVLGGINVPHSHVNVYASSSLC